MADGFQRRYERDDTVKVSWNQPGYEESYFPAIVRARFPPDRVMVEFSTLVEENDETRRLRELVQIDEVRPKPLQLPVASFAVGYIVDAWYNDGWWVGSLREKLGSLCLVSFNTGEEIIFSPSDIRLHQEYESDTDLWVYAKK